MRSILLVLALALVLASAAPYPPATLASRYSAWAAEYNRTEDPARLKTFAANVAFIDSHDADSAGFSVGLNQFADLTNKEFLAVATHTPHITVLHPGDNVSYPSGDSVDWRTKGKVTPVHDLGELGCSQPDAMADTLSSAEAILCDKRDGKLEVLSTAQLLECGSGGVGCAASVKTFGGYLKKHGLLTVEAYESLPGTPGQCRASPDIKSTLPCPVEKWSSLPADDNDAIKSRVAVQPVMVAINAATAAFQFYRTGVFDTECPPNLDHALIVVGYGEAEKPFWIAKNNWGVSWGDQGYINIKRQSGQGPGTCGIASDASYPVLQ